MRTSTREALNKVSVLLAAMVGVQKQQEFTPEQFVTYAMDQIAKAQSEPVEVSSRRLAALHKAVLSAIEDSASESIKVSVFTTDQTAVDEQANQLMTPAKAAGSTNASATVFDNGFVGKKMAELNDIIAALKGGAPQDDEEEEAKAAKKPGEEEEEAKAGKKPGEEEEEAKAGKKPWEKDQEEGEEAKAQKAAWPDDMNDPAFLERGETRKNLDWGND